MKFDAAKLAAVLAASAAVLSGCGRHDTTNQNCAESGQRRADGTCTDGHTNAGGHGGVGYVGAAGTGQTADAGVARGGFGGTAGDGGGHGGEGGGGE